MNLNLNKNIRIYYNKVTESIAFYPALIAIGFLFFSWVMLELDFSTWGKELKSNTTWLSLKDATTARSIIATIAGAIISLTVFSFSMVMIVLNQAASQMSNRVLSSMIGNRFQQTVLGFYIGTIVYALFLLSTIRDITSGVYVPALSIYLLILLTVVDIFLFIYFLDYVTRTVKYETVINRVQAKTMLNLKQKCSEDEATTASWENLPYVEIKTEQSNYFQGFSESKILTIASNENVYITFLYQQSSFLLKGVPFLRVYSNNPIDKEVINEITASIDFYSGQPIDRNADYGFRQLSEIAIKALSPGINDPGTAVIALHSLSDLLSFRIYNNYSEVKMDENKLGRIYIPCTSFKELFTDCMYPIWKYGRTDQYIQIAMSEIIQQLKSLDYKNAHSTIFDQLSTIIQKKIDKDLV